MTSQIDIVMVSCGSKTRFEEVRTMMKSAILSQTAFEPQKSLNFIFFTDSLKEEAEGFVRDIRNVPKLVNVTIDVR